MSEQVVGRVVVTQAFPVKGAGGEPVDHVVLDADGVVGDRRHAVLTDDGTLLTADAAPALRQVTAALGDGEPLLTMPGAPGAVRGAQADTALTGLFGRPVRLARVAAGSALDAPVHLVTRQGLDAAARGEHDAADCACSLSEPRANLVVDAHGRREEHWIGCRLALGDAVLRVVRRPGHCLGVYAEVERAGTVSAGDEVRLLP